MRDGGRGSTGARSHWFQHSLIVVETALAVVLLTCGGLLLRTFHHLSHNDIGMRSERLLTFETPLFRYAKHFDQRVAFINAEVEKVRTVPGVVGAASINLIPFTNFALAGFDPTYDPLALAFLTSPRAQMALLVTAAVASAWNRRYGWDYHGILVPALLGLTVLAPVKLLATVAEAVVVLVLARALLRLPHLRTLNVEGARRVVLWRVPR